MGNEIDSKSIVDEMQLALLANIEYLKKEGNSQLVVKNGKFVGETAGLFLYVFDLEFLQEIHSETEVEVRVKNQSVNGKVVSTDGKQITLQLEKNLGPIIHEARLVVSSYYLLQLLHDKLQATQKGEVKLTDLAEKVFGLKTVQIGCDSEYAFPVLRLVKRSEPNEYQEKAIRQALGSEVLFIWGPPGTGKTTTIAQIVEGFIEKKMSVLLLAHTNVATDGAFKDFLKLQKAEQSLDYENGKFVRVGQIGESLADYDKVRLDVIEQIVGAALRKEIEELQTQIDALEKDTIEHQTLLAQFSQLDTVIAKAKRLGEEMKKKFEENEHTVQSLENMKRELQVTENSIGGYQKKGAIGRFFSTENLPDLMARKGEFLTSIKNLEDEVVRYETLYAQGERIGNELIEERDNLSEKLNGRDRAKIQKEYDETREKVKPLEGQISVLQRQLDEIRAKIISDAKVISTTLTKSYSDKSVLAREYDCVIIDEASMAPLPAVWYACGLAKKKVVIVGDFYQLPPVVKHKVLKERKTNEEVEKEQTLIDKWLSRDIFAVQNILELIREGNKPPIMQQLKIQYRMHPEIADVINELVYKKGDGQFALESGESTFSNGDALLEKDPLSNAHIGFYDTSAKKPFTTRTDSGSYYNLYHAIFCVEMAEKAVKNGYETVGIVTPFRPQANLMQKIVIDKGIGKSVEVDTVHRFQGGQKQLIIFDIVTSQPTKLTDDKGIGGDDEKIINVAFSRAQEKCMVVADIPTLQKKHSESSLFRKYLEYCSDKGHGARSPEEIMTDYEVKEETEKWMDTIYDAVGLSEEAINSATYDETDFYKAFVRDLRSAEHEVIIDSPFIARQRMKTFFPLFDYLLKKSVKVFVLTRKTEEQEGLLKEYSIEAIEQMEAMGVIVLQSKGMEHRKLAIIDRKITWEGSLNILSQRDSIEHMRRFVGPETAKQLMNLLRLERNIGKLGENRLERCEICKDPGAWYWTGMSRFGVWTYCLIGMHAKGKVPKTKAEITERKKKISKARKSKKEYTEDGTPICPEHELPMVKKEGHWGNFWGCQKYPRCRITEKIK